MLRGTSEPATFGLGSRPHSETTASLIDTEVRRIIQENYKEAVRLIRANRKALDVLAGTHVEHEALEEDEIQDSQVRRRWRQDRQFRLERH